MEDIDLGFEHGAYENTPVWAVFGDLMSGLLGAFVNRNGDQTAADGARSGPLHRRKLLCPRWPVVSATRRMAAW